MDSDPRRRLVWLSLVSVLFVGCSVYVSLTWYLQRKIKPAVHITATGDPDLKKLPLREVVPRYNLVVDEDVKKPTNQPNLREVSPGETIQPYPLQIHMSTAVSYEDFPALGGFNLFLNGWARYGEDVDFKCCLLHSDSNGVIEADVFVKVKANLYHQYNQWRVDMQATEFSCSISRNQLPALQLDKFTHVALARNTCLEASSQVLPILYPRREPGSLGLCLKVSYGSMDPTQFLEWMEYHRMMGVTSVFTYTWDLDPPVQAVFDYYVKVGFLTAYPAHPPPSAHGPARGFRRPRYEEQAWVDEVWGCNDCKHRMAGYDYIIVMDMDEIIVPKKGLKTYYDILNVAHTTHPDAGAFWFDSHVFLLDWGVSNDSPLNLGKFTLRTKTPNYDGFNKNSKWASIPRRTYFVQNNSVKPRRPYVQKAVPRDKYTLFHYRWCKPSWKDCETRPRLEDRSMLQYELPLVQRILSLPNLDRLLYNNTEYVKHLRRWFSEKQ